MKVTQVYSIMNTITQEITGQSDLVKEDLTNIVDVGKTILGATDIDNYVKTLADHIGKVIFDNRVYRGNVPSVLMDGWEYGSVLEKISADLPAATENKSWELENGTSYDQQIFYKPTVSAKFFNDKITFEIPMSFTEKQIKSSFSSAEQLNGFLTMIYNSIDKSMTVKLDALIMRTINNFICSNIAKDWATVGQGAGSTNRAVNLLYLYNQKFNAGGTPLAAADALTNKAFLKFAAYIMGLYTDRLSKMSRLFNIGGKDKFTPAENLHIVLLSEFEKAAGAYLESEVYHNELVKLPAAEIVPYWQGSGKNYAFADTSKIYAKIKSPAGDGTELDVLATGVIGVMFDSDALGVANLDRRVTTAYNARAEFFNNFYKVDVGYFNDYNENFVVFYVEDDATDESGGDGNGGDGGDEND